MQLNYYPIIKNWKSYSVYCLYYIALVNGGGVYTYAIQEKL